jgi:hypothetical protein
MSVSKNVFRGTSIFFLPRILNVFISQDENYGSN